MSKQRNDELLSVDDDASSVVLNAERDRRSDSSARILQGIRIEMVVTLEKEI